GDRRSICNRGKSLPHAASPPRRIAKPLELVTHLTQPANGSFAGADNEGRSHMLRGFCLSLGLAGAIVSGAAAQDLPKNQFKVIGLNSPTPVSIHDEVPFWRKTIVMDRHW